MSLYTGSKQRFTRILPWAGGGLLLGLLIGLALGWWVWPVKWVNTDPSDLREQHQITYVQMVADSLAVNGDAHLAGQRLYELTEQEQDWREVAVLIERTAAESEQVGDAAAALRLRRLAEIVQLPEVRTPAAVPEPSPRPLGARTTLLLAGVALVLVALALAIWLIRRFSRRPAKAARAATSPVQELIAARDAARATESGGGGRWQQPTPQPLDAAPERMLASMDLSDLSGEEQAVPLDLHEEDEDLWEDLEEGDLAEEILDVTLADDVESREQTAPNDKPPVEPLSTPARALRSVATARAKGSEAVWGEFETEYRLGDDDFYYAFTVESPEREFVGQCGIVIGDVLSAEQPQRVDAFDVWLFETQGSRTVTQVLASPYAFEDEAQQAKIMRRGEMYVAQPGATLTLEGTHLRLTVTVSDCLYLPWQNEEEAVFSQLAVRMVVEPIV